MLEGSRVFEGKVGEIDIVIRYVRRGDTEKVLSFMNTVSKEQTYITFQGEQIAMADEKKYIEDYIQKTEDKRAVKLLVWHEDTLIGISDVTLKERIESHVGVFGLIVAQEWRGKGIGSLLMRQTLLEAQKNIIGLQIVTLGLFANNAIARQIYEKMGFAQYGLLPGGILHKGQPVDHVYMYKLVTKTQ